MSFPNHFTSHLSIKCNDYNCFDNVFEYASFIHQVNSSLFICSHDII